METTIEIDERKFCYYVNPVQDPKEHGGYVPSVVYVGEDGHYPLLGNGPCARPWVWGKTLEEAERICAEKNAKLGLSKEQTILMVIESMSRSMRKK